MPPSFALDADARRSADGLLLAGGSPARLIRLTPAGRGVVDDALGGRPPAGEAATALLARLVAAGLLHPPAQAGPAALTCVVPVRDGAHWLPDLVAALAADGEVLVVDDRSSDGSGAVAARAGARVVPSAGRPGPAGARNTGLAIARTELVAFADADCVPSPGWARDLTGYFDDPGVALVAPRIRGLRGPRLMDRYEARSSPLDLGPRPGLVGPGRRTGYVPSAACVVRRAPLLALGGFDEDLRWGEDVDLVYRLVAAGWTVRYAPDVVVEHRTRGSVTGFARQRFAYGRSAGDLEARHPGTTVPLHVHPASAGVWAAGAALGPTAAAVTLTQPRRSGRLRDDDGRGAVLGELAVAGHVGATRHLARALAREWLPLTLLAASRSRRARRIALIAAGIDLAATWPRGGGPRDMAAHLAYRPLDHVAYAAGVWRGAVRARSPAVLLPRMPGPATPPAPSGELAGRPAQEPGRDDDVVGDEL